MDSGRFYKVAGPSSSSSVQWFLVDVEPLQPCWLTGSFSEILETILPLLSCEEPLQLQRGRNSLWGRSLHIWKKSNIENVLWKSPISPFFNHLSHCVYEIRFFLKHKSFKKDGSWPVRWSHCHAPISLYKDIRLSRRLPWRKLSLRTSKGPDVGPSVSVCDCNDSQKQLISHQSLFSKHVQTCRSLIGSLWLKYPPSKLDIPS